LWLTTVEKTITPLVTLSVQEQDEGTWTAGRFVGNLGNDGVGLAPFHDWDARVSAELKTEVLQLLSDIKDGTVKADYVPVG
jgi:basic membrane protein A